MFPQSSPPLINSHVLLWLTCCRVEFLSKLNPSPSSLVPSVGRALVERMASRLLVFFVRHAALLRPLGQAGKIQLAKVRASSSLCQSPLRTAATAPHIICMCGLGPPHQLHGWLLCLLLQRTRPTHCPRWLRAGHG